MGRAVLCTLTTPAQLAWNVATLVVLSLLLLGADILVDGTVPPIGPFAYGVIIGRLFWAQLAKKQRGKLEWP